MAPSGVRSPDDAPRPPGTAPGPATLAGTAGGPAGPDTAGGPEEAPGGGPGSMLRQAVQQLRQSEMMLLDLARQFPAAAAALRQAGTDIRAALRQIVASPGQPEPPAPAIGG